MSSVEPLQSDDHRTLWNVPVDLYFYLEARYQTFIAPFVGCGAQGAIYQAKDLCTHAEPIVAIKRIIPDTDRLLYRQLLREIRILRKMRHENIIDIRDVICTRTPSVMKEVFLVHTMMETDLARLLRISRPSADHIQYFLYQMLRGIKYIHSGNVIHRDLKPHNILVNGNNDLKICDFGLARVVDEEMDNSANLTAYVTTRWYRAPEIILNAGTYTKSMDLWSVGCILAEMITGQPLFPGDDHLQHLSWVYTVRGSATPDMLAHFCARGRSFLMALPEHKPKPWTECLPTIKNCRPDVSEILKNEDLLDMLDRLLDIHPVRRVTAEEALALPYLRVYYTPDDEPTMSEPLELHAESDELPLDRIHELIWRESQLFRNALLNPVSEV